MKERFTKMVSLVLALALCVSTFSINTLAAYVTDFTAPPLYLEQTADESAGTVTVTVKASSAFTYLGGKITMQYDENAFGLTATDISGAAGLSLTKNLNEDNKATLTITSDEDVDVAQDGVLLTFVFTKNENITDGDYDFVLDVEEWANSDFGVDTFTTSETNTVTYTVGASGGNTEVTEDYTASLTPTTATVDNNGTDTVSVSVVVGGTTGSFASTEIKLSYDPAYLTYSSGSCALTPSLESNQADQAAKFIVAEDDDGNETGTLTIRDYGGNMTVETNGTTAYTLVFDTVVGGTTNVSLTSAGFSTLENAASENLTSATSGSAVAVTINHKATVTVNGTAGDTTYVTPSDDYTYEISDYNATNYTYTVTAVEDGEDVAADRISIDEDGNVTITGVTGELAVTISKTPNSYSITWKDDEGAVTGTKPSTQNYGTDITFAVKAGEQAADSTEDGYYYSVKAYLTDSTNTAINVSSTETDNYAAKTYTIDANDITGNITIEVTKETVSATETTITIEGPYREVLFNGTAVGAESVTVAMSTDIKVTLDKADGYTYVVKTVIDGTVTEVTENQDGSYTINPGTTGLVLQIFKTLDTTSLEVSEYVQLDGMTMWLVKINGLSDTTNMTYTYTASEGATAENFFWSSKYNTYCFLLVTDTSTNADTVKTDVAGKLGLTGTAAVSINYNGNVNLTADASGAAVIDVNDAQLVWNMYSAVYSDTNTVSVQKFLEADMNGNGSLSTEDAAAVITKIG